MRGSWPWVVLPICWLVGGFLAATWVGTALDGRPPVPAALAAAGVALVGIGIAPLALSLRLRAIARAREWGDALAPFLAGTTFLAALAVLVGVQTATPGGVAGLWSDRRTWLLDAATGRGPFGTAAIPEVSARAAILASSVGGDALGSTLCDASAGALVGGALAAARAPGGSGPEAEVWARLEARAAADARGALQGVVDTAVAAWGEAPVEALLTLPLTPGEAERETLSFTDAAGASVTARYTQGAWRVCVADEVARTAGEHWVAAAREVARARLPPGPDPAETAARDLVRAVVTARSAWALGVPAAPGFPAALAPTAAVVEAERIRAWCRPLAAGDPALAPAVSELDARWAAEPARLPLEGRALLTEVEAACRPVASARVLVENARGLAASAEERGRWARLDGEAAARDAVLTRDGATFRAVVPLSGSGAGPVFVLVPEGSGYVVEGVH